MLTDPTVVSPGQQVSWFTTLCRSSSSERLVAKLETEEKIGLVRLDQIDNNNHSVCVGLDIHMDYRGQGYARKIYDEVFKETFLFMDMHRVWLLVASYNTRAYSLYQKLGFIEEGRHREALFKKGQRHDYIQMGILKDECYKDL